MSYKCLAFAGQEDFLSNIVHLSNVGSMLGQRRRRWPNNKTALDQCLVWVVSCNQFSGYINAVNLYSIGYCWPTLDRPRHARFEAEWFFNVGQRRRSDRTPSQHWDTIGIDVRYTPKRHLVSNSLLRWTIIYDIPSRHRSQYTSPESGGLRSSMLLLSQVAGMLLTHLLSL